MKQGKLFFSIGMHQMTKYSFLDIPTPFRMTPCPHRLQLLTLRTEGILTGKMTFWRDECLSKVVYMLQLDVHDIPTPVRMTPFSS